MRAEANRRGKAPVAIVSFAGLALAIRLTNMLAADAVSPSSNASHQDETLATKNLASEQASEASTDGLKTRSYSVALHEDY